MVLFNTYIVAQLTIIIIKYQLNIDPNVTTINTPSNIFKSEFWRENMF